MKHTIEITSGEFYSIQNLLFADQMQYVFDVEISNVSMAPTVQRAICDTLEQVTVLLRRTLQNLKTIDIERTERSADYREQIQRFCFTALASTDHKKDYAMDITISKLRLKEDFDVLKNVVLEFFPGK